MYKHLTMFLCRFMLAGMIFMPSVSMATDHCTNPTEYTVDKRCYVTDAQKRTSPYNAVVALVLYGQPYCTGTIVKDKNGKPFLYTAKHCADDRKYVVQSELEIKLQDGRKLSVTKNNVGNYDAEHDKKFYGDWAIYSIAQSDVPMVKKSSKREIGVAPLEPYYDATVVGYGALKIMSDAEIADFKSKYITYLKDEKNIDSNGDEDTYGFTDGGVDTYNNAYVKNFLTEKYDYWGDLTSDVSELKLSHCTYSGTGRMTGCQGWGGNSGGPIFDNDGKIMGIYTRGNRVIGGSRHAGNDSWWTATDTSSVSLLE